MFSESSKKLAYISNIDPRIKQEHLHLIDDTISDEKIKIKCEELYGSQKIKKKV